MNYMLYTDDVTCNLSRSNNRDNHIYEKGQQKHFEKIDFLINFA